MFEKSLYLFDLNIIYFTDNEKEPLWLLGLIHIP